MSKIICTFLIVTGLLLSNFAFSKSDSIEGIWIGKLPAGDGTDMILHFDIKQINNLYTVTIRSPNKTSIKNLVASSVTYTNGGLSFELKDLNGSFKGNVGPEKIEGKWKQLDEIIPLTLTPLTQNEGVKKDPSKEVVDSLLGQWYGTGSLKQTTFTSLIYFTLDDAGEISATTEFPEKGNDYVPVKSLKIDGQNISIHLWADNQFFEGRMEKGILEGMWWFEKLPFTIKLKKAEWDPNYSSFPLKENEKKALLGTWYAEVPAQGLGVTVKFNFVETTSGKVRGFINSVDDGWFGVRMTNLEFVGDDKVRFSHTGKYTGNVNFDGKLEKNTLTGTYTFGDNSSKIILIKGEVPPALIDVPESAKTVLVGRWSGWVNGQEFRVRFENQSSGVIGYIDSLNPSQSAVRIRFGSFKNNELSLKTANTGAKYDAKLVDGAFVGTLKQGDKQYELKLVKAQ
jgi:hypothetical protein